MNCMVVISWSAGISFRAWIFLYSWTAVLGTLGVSWARVEGRTVARKFNTNNKVIFAKCRREMSVIRGSPVNCAGIDCAGIRELCKVACGSFECGSAAHAFGRHGVDELRFGVAGLRSKSGSFAVAL